MLFVFRSCNDWKERDEQLKIKAEARVEAKASSQKSRMRTGENSSIITTIMTSFNIVYDEPPPSPVEQISFEFNGTLDGLNIVSPERKQRTAGRQPAKRKKFSHERPVVGLPATLSTGQRAASIQGEQEFEFSLKEQTHRREIPLGKGCVGCKGA